MKKKISLLVVMMIILSSMAMGCSKSDLSPYSLEGIKEKGKLVLGTSADYPPNEFHVMIDGKDEIVGSDIEIGRYIADKLDVELEIKDMEFNNLLGGLSTGMIDIVIAAMTDQPDRDANFTKSYDEDGIHKILIRKSDKDKFKTKEDFNGATLGAQTASLQKDLAEDIEGTTVKELSVLSNLVMELKTEKIDGVVMSESSGKSYAKSNDDIILVDKLDLIHTGSGECIALKSGNDELTEYINEVIDELIEKDLVGKWKAQAKELSNQEIDN